MAMVSEPRILLDLARNGHAAYLKRYRWEAEAPNLRWHLVRAGALAPSVHPLPQGAP